MNTSNGYSVNVTIEGISPILQHAFTENHLEELAVRAKQRTGAPDYTYEWLTSMYVTGQNGTEYLCQPANHIEGSLIKAAVNFKISGKRGKTFKDAVRAYCYVSPDNILHLRDGEHVEAPGPELLEEPSNGLSVSIMRVIISRAAVRRSRVMIDTGWQLAFKVDVIDDQLGSDVLQTIMTEAGRAVGIGDYRPRYGRFKIVNFEVL